MEIEDGRAFRPQLAGRDRVRAQEKLIAAVLRGPSLAPTVRSGARPETCYCAGARPRRRLR
jgi:hypothetical protein